MYTEEQYELKKLRNRGHLLEGLGVAIANLDEVVQLIKDSANPKEAKQALLDRTWNMGLMQEMLKDPAIVRPEHVLAN